MSIKNQGQAVDEFLDMRKTANYLECSKCGVILDMPEHLPKDWKFDLMGLIPSKFFRTIRGICPTCQEMWKQFKGVIQ